MKMSLIIWTIIFRPRKRKVWISRKENNYMKMISISIIKILLKKRKEIKNSKMIWNKENLSHLTYLNIKTCKSSSKNFFLRFWKVHTYFPWIFNNFIRKRQTQGLRSIRGWRTVVQNSGKNISIFLTSNPQLIFSISFKMSVDLQFRTIYLKIWTQNNWVIVDIFNQIIWSKENVHDIVIDFQFIWRWNWAALFTYWRACQFFDWL